MATLKDWLQLFRSHTSPLEMVITITGSALAVGTVLDIKVLLFLLFGWLYHNSGYGHNSVEDFIQGYDTDDPNKSHHPLQRGAMDPQKARYVCIVLIVATFLYGIFISGLDPAAMVILAVITLAGAVYNIFGKRMKGKFIPIALAHSLLLPFSYFGAGGELSFISGYTYFAEPLHLIVVLSVSYMVAQIIYQIMIEGDLKDIDMDEASLLRTLGARVEKGTFKASLTARGFSLLIKSISISLLFWIIFTARGDALTYLLLIVFSVLMILQDDRMMMERPWVHSVTLRDMALMEVMSTFALLLAAAAVIGGIWLALLVMFFNTAYFIIMNRFLWGTIIKPRV
jgi:1,4-dihydroxy-2-naphthoate octaprenyltransferase